VRGRIYVSAAGMSLLIPSLFGVGDASTLGIAILFLALFGLGWGFFDCNNMPILSQIVRPELRATGYGIMNLVSISTGAGATVALGWMRDHGIRFSMAFAISAALALISSALILFLKPAQKQDPNEY